MLKLALVAPTINRDDVGEAWVAYQWAAGLSARFDTTVLTYRKRHQPPIALQLPGVRVVEWREPPLLGRAERLNSLMKPGYLSFAVAAHRWLRAAQARGEHFDVGHQALPVAMRYPSPFLGTGIPYLIGPVGGSLDSPSAFRSDEAAPWYTKLRRLDAWRLRHDRLLIRTFTDAACVLGIASYVHQSLAHLPLRRFEIMSETALVDLPRAVDRPLDPRPVRLLFVGRLIRTKGVRDLIRAMTMLGDLEVRLDVIGEGFDEQPCRDLAREHDLDDRITFHGKLPRADVDEFYRAADLFVFPSYREPGGNVVFEAMGHGLPLVVCDRGGPGAAVDDTCGTLVAAHSPDQLAADVARAVRSLIDDPSRRRAMGRAALRRVQTVGLWSGKVDQAADLYDEVARHEA